MNRQDTFDLLESTTIDDMPYLYVPSYNRPEFVSSKLLKRLDDSGLKKTYLVVRESQKQDYINANKELLDRGCNLLVIPEGGVTGVGSTRNFIIDHACEHDYDTIFLYDDDITGISILWEGPNRSGVMSSRCLGAADARAYDNYTQKIMQAINKVTKEMIAEYPDLALGNIRKQRFSNNVDNAQTKIKICKGNTPRQTCIYNTKLLKETGLRIPPEFDKHGDDIGMAAHLLEEGYRLFNIPWVCYDYVPETVATVLRDIDEEKNRDIHQREYDSLMAMREAKNYIRVTKKYDDGQPMYNDINWRAYHKLHGSKPIAITW